MVEVLIARTVWTWAIMVELFPAVLCWLIRDSSTATLARSRLMRHRGGLLVLEGHILVTKVTRIQELTHILAWVRAIRLCETILMTVDTVHLHHLVRREVRATTCIRFPPVFNLHPNSLLLTILWVVVLPLLSTLCLRKERINRPSAVRESLVGRRTTTCV